MRSQFSWRAFVRRHLVLVAALALTSGALAANTKRLLVVGQSPDGHPPTTHELMPGAHVMSELMRPFPEVKVTVVNGDEPWSEGPGLIDNADGIVMSVTQGARWMGSDAKRLAALKRLAARGGAITALHWAVGANEPQYIQGQLDLLGGTRGGPWRKYKVLQMDMKPVNREHPILSGMGVIKTYDEFYYRLELRPDIKPLYKAHIDGFDETAAWAWERPDGGRSFGFVCLHFHSNWQQPEYRRFVTQGVLWSLGVPIPAGGVKTDINQEVLKLDGVLPPPASPEAEKAAKKLKSDKEKAEKAKKQGK